MRVPVIVGLVAIVHGTAWSTLADKESGPPDCAPRALAITMEAQPAPRPIRILGLLRR